MKIDLYKAHSEDILPKIESKSIDLICADLPYGITKDKKLDLDLLFKEYNRIIKDHGTIALFCQGKFYVDLVNANYKYFRYDIIWNKMLKGGFLNARRQPLRIHEQIAIFYKKQNKYNPQFKEGKPLHGLGTKYKTDKNPTNRNFNKFDRSVLEDSRKGSTEKFPSSIWEFQKVSANKLVHRTEKSIELLKEIILTYTDIGDTVLDNTMGSGSCGVACGLTNRNFIGIENNSDDKMAFEKALQRMWIYVPNVFS